MKYIKKFENNHIPEKLNYNIGDFILHQDIKLHIIGKDQKYHKKVPYHVERSNGNLGWISEKQIKRHLTDEEIHQFLDEHYMYVDAKKYNI